MSRWARMRARSHISICTSLLCLLLHRPLYADPKSIYTCRVLQREGTRDLFSHRRAAMPSDDEDADDGHDVVDFSDDEQGQDDDDEGS